MKEGRIVEEGEPEQLIKEEGHYNLFVQAQH